MTIPQFTFPAGDSIRLRFTVADGDDPVDLTDKTVEFAMSRGAGVEPVIHAQGSPSDALISIPEDTTGVYEVEVPGVLTVSFEGLYHYQTRVTDDQGYVRTPTESGEGFIIITPAVLNPIPEGSPA